MDPDWQHWIERLKSKDLTEAELREFEEALQGDPSRRDAYLSELLAEVALEARDLPDPLAKPDIARMPVPLRRWPRVLGIAAGIAALATVSYFAGNRQRPAPAPDFVATVTDADEPAENAGLRIGQPLTIGIVTVPEGSEIGVAMRGGARLQIRGPANLHIDGPDKVRLDKGRLSTYAPPYAHGFTVDTVDGQVVDLGTRFVTASGTASGTEIHVIEGLVTANASPRDQKAQNLEAENAAILKGGRLEPTEYLAQRLAVPLDPVSTDSDADGFPDFIENHYGTLPSDASSQPVALRIEETFSGYSAGPIQGLAVKATGGKPAALWEGAGAFEPEGLSFSRGDRILRTSGGAISTTGERFSGAILRLDPKEILPDGVTYLSFLMRNPGNSPSDCFSGLLLYEGEREELFVGKLSVGDSYGSRLKQSVTQNTFEIPMDTGTHLFVIRIDRTRLVTDIFVDPVPGQPESAAVRRFRYQDVPTFNNIAMRSGSKTEVFPTTFDEIRLGLTWESVVPGETGK